MDPNIVNNPAAPSPVNFTYPTVGNDGQSLQQTVANPSSELQDQSQVGQLSQMAIPQDQSLPTETAQNSAPQKAFPQAQSVNTTDTSSDQNMVVNQASSDNSNPQATGMPSDLGTEVPLDNSVKTSSKDGVSALQSLAQKLSNLKNDFIVESEGSQNTAPINSESVSTSTSTESVTDPMQTPNLDHSKLGVPSVGSEPFVAPTIESQPLEQISEVQSVNVGTVQTPSTDAVLNSTGTPPTTPTPPMNSPVAVSNGLRSDSQNANVSIDNSAVVTDEATSVATPADPSPTTNPIQELGPMPVNIPVGGIPGAVGSGKSLEDLLKEVEPENVISPETPLVSSGQYTIQQLLDLVIERDASDLHITVGYPVMIRLDGKLQKINEDIVTVEMANELILPVLPEQKKELLEVNREVDLAYSHEESARFRINAYYQQESLAAAFRLIPNKIRSLDELKMPAVYHQLAKLKQGLVLVTGPTGSGKSTTLASILQEINTTRHDHIITIEDPVEYVFPKGVAMVDQREMHEDTHSWEIALKSALRQDPDVLLVGEMRDYETISAAITLAETGHLVFATLHTNSASQTIDRIIDVFPEHQQSQIRSQLSHVIEAVVAQRLIPLASGGRIAVSEIMIANPAVKNLIREAKTHQLDNVIRTSADIGMVSLEHSLVKLVRENLITMDMAQEYAVHPEEVVRLLKS